MITSTELTTLVAYYPILTELHPSLQHAFFRAGYPVRAAAREVLFDIGRPGQSFLMLTSGTIRVTMPSHAREILLYRVQPGGCCILTIGNILGEIQYPARATTENQISAVAIPKTLFKQMVEQSPLFSTFIFRSFAARISELLELMEAITFMSLERRLAGLLLSKETVIQATHSQLADELGSVREVISRILKDFEGKGVLRLERGQVRILDKEALKQIAGPFGD